MLGAGGVPDAIWDEAAARFDPEELGALVLDDRRDQRLEPAADHRPGRARPLPAGATREALVARRGR